MNQLKPDERLAYIHKLIEDSGCNAVVSYFIEELATNVKFKHFDDKCYWLEVKEQLDKIKRND